MLGKGVWGELQESPLFKLAWFPVVQNVGFFVCFHGPEPQGRHRWDRRSTGLLHGPTPISFSPTHLICSPLPAFHPLTRPNLPLALQVGPIVALQNLKSLSLRRTDITDWSAPQVWRVWKGVDVDGQCEVICKRDYSTD
jgi:hypothetical protein